MPSINSPKPLVVFSGVNLIEAGPLSIFKDAISAFAKHRLTAYNLIVYVHDISLFTEYATTGIVFIERKSIKNSYLKRLWFEYVECYYLSKKMQPYLWFALHDITPNVKSVKKVVYCHNATPFYKASFREAQMEPTFFLFTLFYRFLYRINIRSNDWVVVQQDWMRKFFIKDFKVKNVVVAHPNIVMPMGQKMPVEKAGKKYIFFYPSFPRVFKNFETLLEATYILSALRSDFEVIVTIKGNENKYAQHVYGKYKNVPAVRFVGIQPREEVLKLYSITDCLVFPSKLETWGLPISEIKFFNKTILVADEQYSRETVGDYEKVRFFNTENAQQLSVFMSEVIDETIKFDKNESKKPAQPFAENWHDLLSILLS